MLVINKTLIILTLLTVSINAETITATSSYKKETTYQSTNIYFSDFNRLRPVNRNTYKYNKLVEKYNKLLDNANKKISTLKKKNKQLRRNIDFLQKRETKEEKNERAEAIKKMKIEIRNK